MEDIIIVNIDEGTVEVGKHDVTLPKRAADPFKAWLVTANVIIIIKYVVK